MADETDPDAPAGDDVIDTFKKELGPDYDYLADALAPAPTSAAQRIVDRTLSARDNEARTAGVLKEFDETNPGWREHEAEMLTLAQKIHPKGMSEPEYLEHLHDTVVRQKARAAAAVETEKASRERPARDADDDVSPSSSTPSFAECFRAARRGVRFK